MVVKRRHALVLAAAGLAVRAASAQPARLVAAANESAALPATVRAEWQIKAAYLYKFLGFVEWPARAFASVDAPLAIGVLGADPLARELAEVVRSRQVAGRHIVVRRLLPDEGPGEVHVLFVGRAGLGRLPALAASARGQPMLTVTDAPETPAHGSVINFVVVDDKVRFDVVPASAEQMDLKISARLLAVARRVVGAPL